MSEWRNDVLKTRVDHVFEKIKTIPSDLRSGRCLDIGCGMGGGVIAALKHGASLSVGIDRNLNEFQHDMNFARFGEACNFFQVNADQAVMIQADVFKCDVFRGYFDYCILVDTIEHVPNQREFIRYAYRSLKPGGVLLVDTCPLYYSPVGHHLWQWFPKESDPWAHLRSDFDERLKAKGVDQWTIERYRQLNRVTYSEVIDMVSEAGFTVVRTNQQAPRSEMVSLYEKYGALIDVEIPVPKDCLFQDWIEVVARKDGWLKRLTKRLGRRVRRIAGRS
ncbi:MAG: methyltransferase domain-containing protein [Nitrospirota bacterium]